MINLLHPKLERMIVAHKHWLNTLSLYKEIHRCPSVMVSKSYVRSFVSIDDDTFDSIIAAEVRHFSEMRDEELWFTSDYITWIVHDVVLHGGKLSGEPYVDTDDLGEAYSDFVDAKSEFVKAVLAFNEDE